MEKKKSKVITWIIVGITALLAAILLILLNTTALFADIDYAPEHYLSVKDCALRYVDDIDKLVNDPRVPWSYDMYASDYDKDYQSSKGITVGDSFDTFVSVYGDYMADSLSVYENNKDTSEVSEEWYRQHYHYDELVKDFYQNTLLNSDQIDLSDAVISVDFRVTVQGNKVAYSSDDRYELQGKSYDNELGHGGILNPSIQTYTLSFSFYREGNDYVLGYITSYRYGD